MKLDKSKNYGVIYNHPDAMFEQNGVLFDGAGNSLTTHEEATKPAKVKKIVEDVAEPQDDAAAQFILRILKEGPMSKSNVYRECELAQLDWDAVRTAAANHHVHIYKQKSTEYWKLSEHAAA